MDLVLRINNLYRNGSIITFNNTDELLLIRDKLDITGTLKDEYHTVVDGDRLDKLAYEKYNRFVEDSSKYWWVIADANNIDNPLDLTEIIGSELLIPNILDILLKIE